MDNYNELVKSLRAVANNRDEKCDGCPYEEDYPCCVDCLDEMHRKAADAIEKLKLDLDLWKATADDWRDAYHHWLQNYLEFVPVWFPVEEQLPSQEGNYLTAHTTGCVRQNYFMILEDGSVKWWDNSEYAGFVTHWMKLPEPPKEEV